MKRTGLVVLLWGLLILLLGIVALLFNFGVFVAYQQLIVYVLAGVLAGVGVVSIIVALSGSDRWMFFIPGFALSALGSVVYLSTLQSVPARSLGALFLGGVAAGFFVIFLMNRQERWWALLQGCIIVVIALVAFGFGVLPDALLGAVLFGGLGLSFFLVWLLGGNRRRLSWAALMAAVLFAAAFALAGTPPVTGPNSIIVKLWPVLFIIAGTLAVGYVITGRAAPPPLPQASSLVPVEDVDVRSLATTDTAHITRPGATAGQSASSQPSQAIPMPPPPPSSPVSEVLPPDMQTFDPNNPGATLDTLLDASQKTVAG
jgi:hypothetical protein